MKIKMVISVVLALTAPVWILPFVIGFIIFCSLKEAYAGIVDGIGIFSQQK